MRDGLLKCTKQDKTDVGTTGCDVEVILDVGDMLTKVWLRKEKKSQLFCYICQKTDIIVITILVL